MNFQYEAVIAGTGSCLPGKRISNQKLYSRISNFDLERAKKSLQKKNPELPLEKAEEVFDAWVRQVCGIEERPFIQDGEFEKGLEAESMAAKAAEKAILEADIHPDSIDHAIFSTYSSARVMPSPACVLLDKLKLRQGLGSLQHGSTGGGGLEKKKLGCSALTVNGACSGFLDALIDAVIKVRSGVFEHVLVVAADHLSDKMDFNDPTSAIIFSDGAGALVVARAKERDKRAKLLGFASAIEYSDQVFMERKGPIFFKGSQGPLVQRHAVNSMYQIAAAALGNSNLNFEDIQAVIPHQANSRIIEALRKKIHRDNLVVFNQIAKLGNLSSATVPVLLDFFRRKKIYSEISPPKDNGLKAVLTSVGGGYTYSAIVTEVLF